MERKNINEIALLKVYSTKGRLIYNIMCIYKHFGNKGFLCQKEQSHIITES